ncbi:hypothetical protein CO540_18245 [Micromonospora sp. WMMA2032]|uniref:hypothetical protein n=1 Tax=Micromonospora sp. WMMA2032 TaxID=2039870 RepID=UPI000C0587CA|nr:hypothetical protein [Micromonospora sp. WMMA2032]ATO15543.1 hypothetical protein CO540_18245 [Micromonospora sp. WMMA2032]
MQEADVRRALEKKLRRTNIDSLWSFLLQKGYVGEVLTGYDSLDDLLATAKQVLQAGQRDSTAVRTAAAGGPQPGEARAWALSMLVAAEMREDSRVTSFRAEVMNGALRPTARAADWIKGHPDVTSTMTQDITITLRTDQIYYEGGGWARLLLPSDRVRIAKVSARVLAYADGNDGWAHHIGVPAHGQLDRLRHLSESLAKECCWQPAQATMFVLTDAVPLISRIRSTTSTGRPLWASRIRLDIDPAESVREVAHAFASLARTGPAGQARPIKEKHARLAVHALVDHVHVPWSERARLWNAEHPQWRYSSEANFRRDALDARERLYRTHRVGGRGSDD